METYRYRLEERQRRNGSSNLIIQFDQPGTANLSLFLMIDSSSFEVTGNRVEAIQQLQNGAITEARGIGNATQWQIGPETATIRDPFEGEDDVEPSPPVSIPTVELERLMLEWRQHRDDFRRRNIEKRSRGTGVVGDGNGHR